MNHKKCIKCDSLKVIRKGKQNGVQRWFCKDCKHKFQTNKKVLPCKEELFCFFTFNKQTFAELTQSYHIRRKTLQDLIYSVKFKEKIHNPRPIHLSVDTTFFGKFGVTVFRDFHSQENLWFKFVDTEKLIHYEEGKTFLEKLGYEILSVTADGFIGLPSIFPGIYFQFCHYHAKKAIIKYTTLKPKTIAGQELLNIICNLTSYTQVTFVQEIDLWFSKYHSFLKEKTFHPNSSWSYTHKKLRSALKSLQRMSHYLFAYQTNPNIPSTSNTCEGHFAHLKLRLAVHKGLSTKHQKFLITAILLNSTVSYQKNMHQKLLE